MMSNRERRIRDLEMRHLCASPLVERLAMLGGCTPRELIAEAYRVQHLVGDCSLEEGARLIAAREGWDADEVLADIRRLQDEVGA